MNRRTAPLASTTFLSTLLISLSALSLSLSSSTVSAQATQPGAAPAAPVYKAKSPKLSRAELDALLAKPDQVVIIDVRRPDELSSIGGFPAYLSIQSKELEKNLGFVPRDRAIVTVSNHAGRAGAAADLLASKGFKVAGAVGAQDYEAEGGSLVKVSPPPPRTATAPAAAATNASL
ncbi:rhodanese-like domain-containing protein [Paucibacter sp. Y2R2-4]|uniref:rhodanese-like domain-containing protein n=1 Tax=Paucibacter sp. Y2R2-4 TaxID=2893553 RepID=UPI0021E47D4B|nr:rhodanese-like domain-containing protein [Paucibacter sp. Y2R2-4]MCV2348302.1 rhodanese-like domain-containing protein [Paucibacter sp. Y2R2-4]